MVESLWCTKCADAILGYDTVKTVRVNNRCIGGTRLVLLVGLSIFLFWNFCFNEYLFLEKETPVGNATVTIIGDESFSKGQFGQDSNPYCDNRDPNAKCVFWDKELARFPQGETSAFSITTNVCEQTGENCKFLNGVEDFEILLQHQFQCGSLLDKGKRSKKFSGVNTDYEGKIVYSNGNEKKFKAGEEIKLTVKELLKAAGVSIDENDFEKRKEGLVLNAQITYKKLYPPFTHKLPTWSMKIRAIPNAKWKARQTFFTQNPSIDSSFSNTDTTSIVRNSIHITFEIGGEVGRYDFRTTFNNILLQFACLVVITMMLDYFLLYCPWTSKNFTDIKYQETEFNLTEQIKTRGSCERPDILLPSEFGEQREEKYKEIEMRKSRMNLHSELSTKPNTLPICVDA